MFCQNILVAEIRNWGITGYSVPPDTPSCGFSDEKCPVTLALSVGVPVGIIGGIGLIAAVAVFIYR